VWQLRDAGYSVDLDLDWRASDNVVLRMNDALERAGRILMLWSAAYFEHNRFTVDEWSAVMADRPDERPPLVPVRLAEVDPPLLLKPLAYKDLHGLDEEPPRLPGRLPPVWNAPRRNPLFTGRDDLLVALRERLSGDRAAVVQAVEGMGGVGKTTLAIEYAHRFASSYELVWWIDAEQTALIGDQFTALGVEAKWINSDVPTTNPAALVMRRLRVEGGWLLVFDNATSREDLVPWLLQGSGHILVTSRNPAPT
jgi:hypothetical protein